MSARTARAGVLHLPEWCRGPDEVIVRVEVSLPIGPSEEATYVQQGRSLRRVLRYAFADGPVETLRKIRSRKLEEQIKRSREVVIVAGRMRDASGSAVVAIGTRHPRWVSEAPFHRELTFSLPAGTAPLEALSAVVALAPKPDMECLSRWLAELFGYDPASERRPERPAGLSAEAVIGALSLEGGKTLDWVKRHSLGPPLATAARTRVPSVVRRGRGRPVTLLVGAGNYARTQAARNLEASGAAFACVVDRDPICSALVARALNVARCETEPYAAIRSVAVDLVVITSFHDSHAPLTIAALAEGRAVFTEKPPATTEAQLSALVQACAAPGARWRIGYNRRYAPFVRAALPSLLRERGPTTVTCVVREASIPRGHWYYWPSQGTRIIANLCHWIDLGFLLCDRGRPVQLTVAGPETDGRRDEETVISIVYEDGSVCTVVGTSRGDGTLGVQETIDVRRGECTVTMRDFVTLDVEERGGVRKQWRGFRDKGHRDMFRSCARWARGEPSLEPLKYELRDLWVANLLTLHASELALRGGGTRSYAAADFELPCKDLGER